MTQSNGRKELPTPVYVVNWHGELWTYETISTEAGGRLHDILKQHFGDNGFRGALMVDESKSAACIGLIK